MGVWEYGQLLAVIGLATLCQNLTGFAFALIFVGICGALQLVPIGEAANIASLLSMVNGLLYLRAHPFTPRWDLLKPLAITSMLGVLAGLGLLHWLSGNALQGLRMLLGLAVLGCAVILLLQKTQRTSPSGRLGTWTAGALSGVLGGLFSTSGPPLVYFLYRQPLAMGLVRQCLLILFLISSVLRLSVVVAMGELQMSTIALAAVGVPMVAFVTWLMARYAPPLPQRLLQWLVCGLLVIAGASLLWSA